MTAIDHPIHAGDSGGAEPTSQPASRPGSDRRPPPSARPGSRGAGEPLPAAVRLRSAAERLAGQMLASAAQGEGAPGESDPESLARACLVCLGQEGHPDAIENPVHALYQVAVDFQSAAEGYRNLYEYTRSELGALRTKVESKGR